MNMISHSMFVQTVFHFGDYYGHKYSHISGPSLHDEESRESASSGARLTHLPD